jgi:hypothetical protein
LGVRHRDGRAPFQLAHQCRAKLGIIGRPSLIDRLEEQGDPTLALLMGQMAAHMLADHARKRAAGTGIVCGGAMVVALTEIVPAHVRTSGFSLAYSLATTVGGFSLAICTTLIAMLNDKAAPGIWLSLAAVCGLIASLIVYRTRILADAGTASAFR